MVILRAPIWLAVLAISLATACAPRTEPAAQPFPEVDAASLTGEQQRVVDVLRQQYQDQQPGTFYAEGIDEPWCADFVTWVMAQSGQPLVNPVSGHWRIPGVYTLQEFYQGAGRFEPFGYQPAVGDVVLYDEPSALGLHANVVVTVDGSTVTTVGGNEPGGISVRTLELGPDAAILGYGRLT